MRSHFLPIGMQGRAIRIEYRLINADRHHAPILVFLHEGLGSVAMWRDFPDQLCHAAQCRGLVYSRPGYGRSTARNPEQRWQPDFMHQQAQQVLPEILTALNIDPARESIYLFGHSDGGSISLLNAAMQPNTAKGLIVLAPHIFVEDISISSIEVARSQYTQGKLRDGLSKYHDDPDSAFWGWNDAWLNPDFRSWNIQHEVSQIRCPILVIQGEQDQYGSMAQIDEIQRCTPATRLLKLAQCGHWPHRDQTQAVIAASVNFLAAN